MNTKKVDMWHKLKAVRVMLSLIFVCGFLTGCGNFKLSGLSLDRVDTLGTVTGGVIDARQAYLKEARKCLSDRGVVIAMPATADDATTLDFSNIGEDADTLTALKGMTKSILMTSGGGVSSVSGSMSGTISDAGNYDGTYSFPYKLYYGKATYNWGGSSPGSYTMGTGWYLWIDLSPLGDISNKVIWKGGTSSNGYCNLNEALGFQSDNLWNKAVNCTDGLWRGGVKRTDNFFADGETFYIVWSTQGNPVTVQESTYNYPTLNPTTDRYGAFGTGAFENYTNAYTSHNSYKVIEALLAMSGSSTVMAPSNVLLSEAGEQGYWVVHSQSNGSDGYIRTGPFYTYDTTTLTGTVDSDLSTYNVFAWDGKSTNRLLPGYEALTSSVIDYGHIWVLSPEASASEISDVQKKLNKFLADNGQFSTVLTTDPTGEGLDGAAALTTAFKETELCIVPPGFGILCYSVIPRNGFLNMVQADTQDSSKIGLVRPVFASGESKPSVGLGFVGPNPQVLSAMNTVLGSSGGGFAVINQHIYLMTYPVSTVGYLYTGVDANGQNNAYIGLGASPIYYNLIYDRLDYKYGDSYQFTTTATAATEDPLYADYNFVGGIAVKDTTGTVSSSGGVYILQDENGNNTTCRVQIAAKDNVESAKEQFQELVRLNYVHPVPVWDTDPNTAGNQSYVFIDGTSAEDYLRNTALYTSSDGGVYFSYTTYAGTGVQKYLGAWAESLDLASLEVPQFVLMDYVESTLLPGATPTNDVVLTGRKIRLIPDAIQYDSTNHLYYYAGKTGLKIGEYVTTDGNTKVDDLFLGDVVDIRALCGVGYTKQACTSSWTEIQPPYGYNTFFPIGINIEDYKTKYAGFISEVDSAHGNTALTDWANANLQGTDPSAFGTMNYWDGLTGTIADASYYQSVAAVNAVASLTSSVVDESGKAVTSDAVVACLNISGADLQAHLGETEITMDTRIDELPYVCTDIITFSEPFPNTIFTPDGDETTDCDKVYRATEENAKTPNVMYTIAVGTGITHGNFYHAWVSSEAPTDSLTWWNNYLDAHGFSYKLNPQVVKQYLETNYSYLANEDNRLRFDVVGAEYWSDELDVLNPNRGGNRTVNLIMTLSNVFGWICIVYALLCLLFWAIDIYAGLDKDFYRLMTGGRYVASAEAMPPTQHVHYATFLNALARSVIICIAGVVLIYVGAAVILAKMFKFLALILRLVAGYWKQ